MSKRRRINKCQVGKMLKYEQVDRDVQKISAVGAQLEKYYEEQDY